MSAMTTLTGWLNTSATKDSVWVKPKDTNTLVNTNIFVNLESKDALRELVGLLRDAFVAKTSYELIVETSNIQRSKGGSLFIETTLAAVLKSMTEAAHAEAVPVDPEAVALARSIRANLATRKPRETEASTVESDDFLSF